MTATRPVELPELLLTPEEAAERLRVGVRALYRWRQRSRPERPVGPPWVRVGEGRGRIRYPAAALDQYLRQSVAA